MLGWYFWPEKAKLYTVLLYLMIVCLTYNNVIKIILLLLVAVDPIIVETDDQATLADKDVLQYSTV